MKELAILRLPPTRTCFLWSMQVFDILEKSPPTPGTHTLKKRRAGAQGRAGFEGGSVHCRGRERRRPHP